jgi:hypothetical protein
MKFLNSWSRVRGIQRQNNLRTLAISTRQLLKDNTKISLLKKAELFGLMVRQENLTLSDGVSAVCGRRGGYCWS